MRGDRSVEYPGIFSFSILLACTLACLIFMPGSFKITGILLILWALTGVARGFWLSETGARKTRPARKSRRPLPRTILTGMEEREKRVRGLLALNTASFAGTAWVVLGAFYLLVTVTAFFNEPGLEAYLTVKSDINAFLETYIDEGAGAGIPSFFPLWQQLSILLLTGLVFWLTRSYAYSRKYADVILWAALPGFFIAMLMSAGMGAQQIFPGDATVPALGYGNLYFERLRMMGLLHDGPLTSFQVRLFTLGSGATGILYVMGGISAFVLAGRLLKKGERSLHALTGLAVLAFMALADLYFMATPRLPGLFLAGWATVAVMWERSHGRKQKSYRMRQI